ncbi:MAG: glycosyltransferase [Rhodobacteraceae bacterium]|nr:glycosyltransferase [Paracoccaceae bacterium]
MRVMIVVTHLLGTGHLGRALTLGRGFSTAGHTVMVASGGRPAPHLQAGGATLLQLPALASDGTDFATLLDDTGAPAGEALFADRRQALRQALTDFAPDVLITELYPFGRRILRHEFLDLLEAAEARHPRPMILSSIRDILAPPSKPARAEAAADVIEAHYDGVLVHSDPAVTRLEASWPLPARIADRLHYTGYVSGPAPEPHPAAEGQGEVLVSTGGGAVGDPIFAAALGAARLRPDLRFRLLIGGGADRVAQWTAQAGDGVHVEPVRPDFRQMLCRAAASVSMCGYNTAMDLLQTGCPSVIVPFDAGQEVEQSLRAQSLAQLDGFACLPTAEMTPERLAAALDRVQAAQRRDVTHLRFDGVGETIRLVTAGLRA